MSGSRVQVDILVNSSQENPAKNQQLFILVGNDLTKDTHPVDLQAIRENPDADLLALAAPGPSSPGQKVLVLSVVLSILAVIVIVGAILLIVFRRQISEYFKCGEYLVNNQSDLEDGDETEKEPIGKTVDNEDVKETILQPGVDKNGIQTVLVQKPGYEEDPVETSLWTE